VPTVVCQDVRQPITPPAGVQIAGWFARQRWLSEQTDAGLLAAALRRGSGLTLTRHELAGKQGWCTEVQHLRQQFGMRWEVEVDDAVAGLVAACTGTVPLGVLLDLLAGSVGAEADDVARALLPVVRDFVARGFLEPEDAPCEP
jgi:hypothetical protein